MLLRRRGSIPISVTYQVLIFVSRLLIFFTRAHGLGWIFVSGIYQEKVIVILRNDGSRKDAGKLARHAFGSLGSAGGRRGAARAEIPLSEFKSKNIKGQGRRLGAFIRKRLAF